MTDSFIIDTSEVFYDGVFAQIHDMMSADKWIDIKLSTLKKIILRLERIDREMERVKK